VELDIHRPRPRSRREPYERLDDGAYACKEGWAVKIVVRGATIATMEVEGLFLPPDHVRHIDGVLETSWRYEPNTFAGRVRCLLGCGDEEDVIDLDIAPAPDKLGKDAFLDLVAELNERVAGLPWGIAPGQFGAAIGQRSALVARPRLLEALLPVLERTLQGLRNEPLLRAQRRREVRRMSHSRRPDPLTVRRLSQTPTAAITLATARSDVDTKLPPIRVDQSVTVITSDHPVARYLVGLLRRLEADLVRTAEYLERGAEGEIGGLGDEAARAYCTVLAEKVRAVIGPTVEALNRPPFAGIDPGPMTESVAQALPDHPPSMALHRIALRMRDKGLSPLQGAPLAAGLRETCELYEFLVLFRLADALALHLGAEWRWKVTRPPKLSLLKDAPESGTVLLSNGDMRFELRTQRTFRPTNSADIGEAFVSLAGRREPDYVLGLFDNDDLLLSWMVLDAKFRTKKRHVRDSLSKIHIYRDGLRWNGLTAAGGYAIVPRILEPAALYASDAYRKAHNFGVLCCPLEPDDGWLCPVLDWIDLELSKIQSA
jgi:hypothetical protein